MWRWLFDSIFFLLELQCCLPSTTQTDSNEICDEEDEQATYAAQKSSATSVRRKRHSDLRRESVCGWNVVQFWDEETSLYGVGICRGGRLCIAFEKQRTASHGSRQVNCFSVILLKGKTKKIAIFNRVWKVLPDFIGFASSGSMIGLENLRHPLNQSNARVKPIATFLLNLQRMRNLKFWGNWICWPYSSRTARTIP